jgi:hypothetical protein
MNPPTATLAIPAAYVDDVRTATAYEISQATHAVFTELKAIREAGERGEDPAMHAADWRGAIRLLAQDGALLDQLEAAGDGEDFTASAEAATLAHIAEAMARKVIAPRIKGLLNFTPLDGKLAAELRESIARLTWAVDNAAHLFDPDADDSNPLGPQR